MSLEKRKASVGAFILCAIGLLVIGILTLGGSKYFSNETEYQLYFSNSVTGLNVGAPVLVRGVPMGTVTHIGLLGLDSKDNMITLVSFRFNSNAFVEDDGEPSIDENQQQELVREMVSKGLRAQLQTASFVTGQACIMLDFFPETEAVFVSSNALTEIPTIKSPIQTLSQTFRKVHIEKIASDLQTSVEHLNNLFGSGRIENTLQSIEDTFTTLNTLLKGFEKTPALTERILSNMDKSTAAAPAIMEDLRKSMEKISQTMDEIHSLAASAKSFVDPNSAMATQLNNLVRDGAAATRALRHFADTLDRNPESILLGRKGAY